MPRLISAQIESKYFDLFNLILITKVLYAFKMACDTNGVHKDAATGLSNVSIKKSASPVLKARLVSRHKHQNRLLLVGKTTRTTTFSRIVDHLLHTYSTEENIADTKDEIMMFSQVPDKPLSKYPEKLVAKTLCCGDTYEEHDRNEIFIERLRKFIRNSMGGYWDSRQSNKP